MLLIHLFFNLQIPVGSYNLKAYDLKLMSLTLWTLSLMTTGILRSTLPSKPPKLYCSHNVGTYKN